MRAFKKTRNISRILPGGPGGPGGPIQIKYVKCEFNRWLLEPNADQLPPGP